MSVYGIGAYYYGDYNQDVSSEFVAQDCICIGYEKEDAGTLYEMFRRIKLGDIVYIKSIGTPRGPGQPTKIYIKAIGIVTGWKITKYKFSNSNDTLGYGRKVVWFRKYNDRDLWKKIELKPEEKKNNVYSNTLYEEYSTRIIQLIVSEITDVTDKKKWSSRRN